LKELIEGVIEKEQRILELIAEIQQSLASEGSENKILATQNEE